MRATFLKFSLMALALSICAPQAAMATHRLQTTQQVRTVRGTVIDAADNQPVIGASIVLSGTSIGTITDVDGKFTIKAVGKNPKLVISYIGKKTIEMSVPESGVISVKLENTDDLLDEVVVVGAGTQKKVSVTGAITSIKGSQLAVPSSSLSTAFAGRIAGVVARQNSGEPGSGAEFYIRGIGTFGGRATPLILLDDVEVSAPDLNYVPAENIESFSILKDASATAIYGARGANGVMIVTTKGGDYNSKTRLNMTVENSFNYIDQFPKFVDGARYMEMYNEAARGSGQAERYTALEIERTRTGYNPLVYPDVNWKDLMFKNMSMRQAVNVNVSGGGSKMK
ncbi:SusC/RagA family TonB-linked outer membrane protein, partial [Hoylesella buccalis]